MPALAPTLDRSPADLGLRRLDWDTEMLGVVSGLIDCTALAGVADQAGLAARLARLIEADPEVEFTAIKLPTRFSETLDILLSWRARLIDVEMVFVHRAQAATERGDGAVVFTDRIDRETFTDLAEEMVYSRFFMDPFIPRTKAAALWRESLANHCQGRADLLAVAFRGGRPAGLTTLKFAADGSIDLHIVGVLREFRGRGVGSELLTAVTARYGYDYRIAVETSARNLPAQGLYRKAGFRLDSMRHVLHVWNPAKSRGC